MITLDYIYDAHSHAHLLPSELSAARHFLKSLSGAALMSTQPTDWGAARALAHEVEGVRCLFGVHPWFAHQQHNLDELLDDLGAIIAQTPGAAIGEIGLDRKWVTPDTGSVEYEAQLKVFRAQLELAASLELPVSVHCVHAQGDLYRILSESETLPPTIYLHAFGGAAGTVEQLIRSRRFGDRLYFGFAACINLRSPKTRSVVAAVPEDRLLLESDRASVSDLDQLTRELSEMLKLYAEVKGWLSLEDAARRLVNNATRCYAPADCCFV